MCLIDTIDGALMLSLYIQPAKNFLPKLDTSNPITDGEEVEASQNHRDPVAFLYYSIVLTTLTVVVAIVIGVIQLLTLIQNAADVKGKFWDGVETAGDYYDVIGGSICGCFVIVGGLSVVLYRPWRRRMARKFGGQSQGGPEGGYHDDVPENEGQETGTVVATETEGEAAKPARPVLVSGRESVSTSNIDNPVHVEGSEAGKSPTFHVTEAGSSSTR